MTCGIADPHATHTQPRDESNRAVDRDRLPMIAAEPAEWMVEPRRVVAADVDAAAAQAIPESRRRLPEPAHPVVQQANLNALGCLAKQRIREQLPLIVFVDDVHLEVNRLSRIANRGEPGRVVL